MRTGQSFDQQSGDRNRPFSDPRILDEIQRRTPMGAGDAEVTHLPGHTVITPVSRARSTGGSVPFCILVSTEADTLYKQPDTVSEYRRPNGRDFYTRPPKKITVCEGDVYSWALYQDASGNALPGGVVVDVDETSWENIGDNSDHGVWLEASIATQATEAPAPFSTDATPEDLLMDGWATTVIKLSGRDGFNDQWTQGSDLAAAILASTNKSYLYVGRVQIDADGNVTITQKVNEDVFWVHPTYEDGNPTGA